jgi:hypothetical protein
MFFASSFFASVWYCPDWWGGEAAVVAPFVQIDPRFAQLIQ